MVFNILFLFYLWFEAAKVQFAIETPKFIIRIFLILILQLPESTVEAAEQYRHSKP